MKPLYTFYVLLLLGGLAWGSARGLGYWQYAMSGKRGPTIVPAVHAYGPHYRHK